MGVGEALGVRAFGIYQVELPPGTETIQHDHLGDSAEDVYAVVSGTGVVVVDGQDVAVAPGQFIAVSPESSRLVRAGEAPLVSLPCAPRQQGRQRPEADRQRSECGPTRSGSAVRFDSCKAVATVHGPHDDDAEADSAQWDDLDLVTLDQALVDFHRAGGSRYRSLGALAGGEVGASSAIDHVGRRVVVKWEWPADVDRLGRLRNAARVVARLRSRGARLPEYLVVEPVGDGVLVVQERMPGTAGDDVPASLLQDLVAHNQLQAGAARGGAGWKAYVRRSLLIGLDGYCEHASLHGHSAATGDLLVRIRAAGEALAGVELVELDAVYLDFHHRNVLSRDGRLSALIDCEGYRSGDRVFDLITLAFCLAVAACPAVAQRDLWQQIRAAREPVIVEAYVAHQALRQVDWSIRHRTPSDVAAWVGRSRELLS